MKTKRTKKPDTKRYGSFWTCPNCEGSPEFEHKDMMTHFTEAHQIDPAKTKGKKSMLMHMDGSNWFSSSYEWTIGELKFNQSITTKRTGSNPEMWGS